MTLSLVISHLLAFMGGTTVGVCIIAMRRCAKKNRATEENTGGRAMPKRYPVTRPWYEDPVRVALWRIEAKLNLVLHMERVQMAMFDDLETKLTEVEGAAESTVVLLTEIHRELQEALAAHDPARVQAVMDRMDAMKVKLGDAVAAHPDPNPNPTPAPIPNP